MYKETEKEHKDYERQIEWLKNREEVIKNYKRNILGTKSFTSTSSMMNQIDLDDIDLITERLNKFGVEVEKSKTHAYIYRHPKVPKLNFDEIFRLREQENMYEEGEEEDDEEEEIIVEEELKSSNKKFFVNGSVLVSDQSNDRREKLRMRKEQVMEILSKTYGNEEESEVPVSPLE